MLETDRWNIFYQLTYPPFVYLVEFLQIPTHWNAAANNTLTFNPQFPRISEPFKQAHIPHIFSPVALHFGQPQPKQLLN